MLSVVWVIFAGLLLTAAATDARTYRIPNWVSAALIVLFLVSAPVGLGFDGVWPHVAVAFAVFLAGYLLHAVTGMGAGDAKLATAIALWVGPAGFQSWITAFALAMLVLAFGLIGARRVAHPLVGAEPATKVLRRGAPVPLGIALSASAIIVSLGLERGLWLF